MNWGDNPIISQTLQREYDDSVKELCEGDIEAGYNKISASETLPELIDRGFTPRILSQSDISWKQAVRRFGIRGLIKFGMTWELAKDMKINANDMHNLSLDNLIEMRATCSDLIETGLNFATLMRLKPSGRCLQELGFTVPILQSIGVTTQNMDKLNLTRDDWENMKPRRKEHNYLPKPIVFSSHSYSNQRGV